MTARLDDGDRWAMSSIAAANVSVGLIMVGADGLGPVSTVLRDVVGSLLVIQAVFLAVQVTKGRLYRIGEEALLINTGLLAFAAYQILITGQDRPLLATIGHSILVATTTVALILYWGHLSGRRLGRARREARMKSESTTL